MKTDLWRGEPVLFAYYGQNLISGQSLTVTSGRVHHIRFSNAVIPSDNSGLL